MALRRSRRFGPTAPRVRSEPMEGRIRQGEEETKPQTKGDWSIGIALVIFGGMGWLIGAWYTLFGWVTGANLFFERLGLPIVVPIPAGWWILAMVPLGYMYSRVELQIWKARNFHGEALLKLVAGWALIVATDVGTTYIGVRTPQLGAWPITVTIAESVYLAFSWAMILTFASDWLIIGGRKMIRW